MKQFKTVYLFELTGYLKNKVFVGVTLFFMLLIGIVLFLPRIFSLFSVNNAEAEQSTGFEEGSLDIGNLSDVPLIPPGEDAETLLLNVEGLDKETADTVETAVRYAFSSYKVVTSTGSDEEIMEEVNEKRASFAFIVNDTLSYKYLVENLGMYDVNEQIMREILQKVYQMQALSEYGISPEQASEIMSREVTGQVIMTGKDQMQNFFYTYIMIFALYMVILLYGQMVATSVATEKSSRAMEVLVTSARPNAMMFGKVLASCTAGLLQLILIFGSALLFYKVNESYWSGIPVIGSLFAMPASLFLYMLLFFLLGYFLYGFMYGAVGSTASKLEDMNTAVMPVTMIFIVGFFVAIFSLSGGATDGILMKVCSFIPFTSPMVMFSRIAMSVVPPLEIIISVAILVVSVIGIGILSAKIYRAGVLMYGTRPKLGDLLKIVFTK